MITMQQARQQSPEVSKMMGAILIAIMAMVAFGLSMTTAIIYRRKYVPVNWHVFLMMALGALGVFSFYIGRIIDLLNGAMHLDDFILPSRILWGFVMAGTALLAISVLVAKRPRNVVK